MGSVKRQFFLTFVLLGCTSPFLAVYLREVRGLEASQIGYVVGAAGFAIFISPIILTLLADTRLAPRRLVGICFLLSGLFLLCLPLTDGFWPTLLLYAFHMLAFVAIIPLQDGIFFARQRGEESTGEGRPRIPYHRIRVWGTIGFIFPSLGIYLMVAKGATIALIIPLAVLMGVAGWWNTRTLPATPPGGNETVVTGLRGAGGLPTTAALRALLKPNAFVFCLGIAMAHVASTAYFAFFPLYLTEEVGLDSRWIGLIYNVGVVVEVGFVFAMGWLIRRMGLRNLILFGLLALALRCGLLALWPIAWVTIVGQVLHGFFVISLFIAPVVYVNRQAEDRYRNSIQGIYTMAVVGIPRVAGSILSGFVAQQSMILLYTIASGLCLAIALLFLLAFQRDPRDRDPF